MTQHKELPVLPDPDVRNPNCGSYFDSWTKDKVEAYGQQCAAHAREVLAKQYRHELDKLGLRNYELRHEIEALKGK